MTYYSRSGNTISVIPKESLNFAEKLPASTYTIGFNPMSKQYYLEITEDLKVPKILYGDCVADSKRILNTFEQRNTSTGVLLCGEKGSGKTLLTKVISRALLERGIPTIIVSSAYSDSTFLSFIKNIEEECLLIFDEFEKMYSDDGDDENNQEQLLTLFDGVFSTKKLIILTANHRHLINDAFINRPGRIYYHLEFNGLSEDFITEYCNNNLNNQVHLPEIIRLSELFNHFNFDLLAALVEELNRYNTSVKECLKFLNIHINYDIFYRSYDVKVNGKSIDSKFYFNPYDENYHHSCNELERNLFSSSYVLLKPADIIEASAKNKYFKYKIKNVIVELTPTTYHSLVF